MRSAPFEEVITMWPPVAPARSSASILGTKARMPLSTPQTFGFRIQSQSSSPISQVGTCVAFTPALRQTTSIAPKAESAMRGSRSMSAKSLTSTGIATAWTPCACSSRSASASRGASRSAMTTRMPSRPSRRAIW